MSTDPASTDDDEALTWTGDETPETVPPRSGRAGTTPRRGRPDRLEIPDDGESAAVGEHVERPQTGSIALVVLGLLAGAHLFYTVGWVLAIGPLDAFYGPSDVVGGVIFSIGLVLAAASPVVWAAASVWFTRSRPIWQRIAALAIGAAILVPWPFIVGVR
jgi:hypothetical protein